MNDHRSVVASDVREILNYFGKCPLCGYPARASAYTAQFDDGHIETQILATCGLPCGWNGPASGTPMTPTASDERNTLPPNTPQLTPIPERKTS